jgi:hypothetical protein
MPNPSLPGSVQPAPAGLNGFDVNQVLTAEQAVGFKKAGCDFCIRYVPRTAAPALQPGNLTNAEALDILGAGLALMAVQHVARSPWQPNTNLGTAYGNFAASYAAQVVNLPPGMNIWCDLEMVPASVAAAHVIAYCQAWYYAVHAAGYVPGLYVGYGTRLTADQLYNDTSFQHYWQAYNGDGVATRGFQLLQKTQKKLGGIEYDPDVTQVDGEGGTMLWLAV